MSRKFSITISDDAHTDLGRLAERGGDTLAGKAAFFVEHAIESARNRGELSIDADAKDVIDHWNNFLDAIEQGNFYTDKQISVLAVQVDRSVKSLHRIQACYQKERRVANEK